MLLIAGGLLLLAGGGAGIGVWRYARGPGFERETGRLAALLELRPGMTVADVGAGNGRIAARLAQRLDAGGRIYATEIDPGKLASIRQQPALVPVEATEHSTGLPEACCDAIYFRRVYHHVTDRVSFGRGIYAALRPGGRLVAIDMISARWLPFLHHGIARGRVESELTAAGFTLERVIPRWSPVDYCLVFRKAAR